MRWASRTRRSRRRGCRRSFPSRHRGARAVRPETSVADVAGSPRPRPTRTRGAPDERSRSDGRASPAHRGPGRPPGGARGVRARPRPVHHAHAPAVRGADGGGHRDHRAERGHDPGAGGDRVPRRARRPRAVPSGGRRRAGRPRAVPARDVSRADPGDGARALHAIRAQPREQRRDRRHAHRARSGVRLAVRPRPGRRTPLRHARRLPELRAARVHGAVPAPLGRDRVRAGRPAR